MSRNEAGQPEFCVGCPMMGDYIGSISDPIAEAEQLNKSQSDHIEWEASLAFRDEDGFWSFAGSAHWYNDSFPYELKYKNRLETIDDLSLIAEEAGKKVVERITQCGGPGTAVGRDGLKHRCPAFNSGVFTSFIRRGIEALEPESESQS